MNPEFQRNLILEFSFARLLGMPLFLLVIFALTYLVDEHQLKDSTANAAMSLFVIIVLFWGARQTAESIFDELRNHTWDIQKTSALSAWSLTWGKLLGSTLFNWYGGLLCLIVYSIATPTTDTLPLMWVYAISGGIVAQSLGLLTSLLSLRRKQMFNSVFNYALIFCMLPFFLPLMFGDFNAHSAQLHWYSATFDLHIFIAASLVLTGCWAVIGVSRLLAEELQIRTLPWIWLGFIGFLILYFTGLIVGGLEPPEAKQFILLKCSFAICWCLTYLLILSDNNNPMTARRVWLYSTQQQWLRVLEETPCWFISLLLLIPVTLSLSVLREIERVEQMFLYPIPTLLLLVRDCAVILFFSYAPNAKRAAGLSFLYLMIIYWILPAIFLLGGNKEMAAVFLPLFSDNIAFAIIFAGGQAGLAGFLLYQRWQKTLNHLTSL
jgi:hypothetical protein